MTVNTVRFSATKTSYAPSLRLAEVIFIEKALVDLKVEIAQADLFWIGGKSDPTVMADAIILSINVKLIELRIGPAKRDLEHIVKIGNRAIVANQQPTPDHRTDLAQPYVNLVRFGVLFFGHYAGSLAKSYSSCQNVYAPGVVSFSRYS